MMRYQTKPYRALFHLLKAGLWEQRIESEQLFPLTASEWQSVFLLAQQQTVLGITYRGLDYIPEQYFPPQELIMRWVAEIGRIEERNYDSNHSLVELLKLFGKEGLQPILQKGQGVATFYDRPLLRTCGDIDLWFPTHEEADRAAELVKLHGGSVHKAPDGSRCYMWRGIEVEHHPDLVDLQAPMAKRKAQRMVAEMTPIMVTLPEHPETAIATPSAEVNLLLLNTHILKHAIGWGVGLRQMCDMARAYYSLHERVDGELIRSLYAKSGLRRWSRLLHAFLVDYLGLEVDYLPYRESQPTSAEPLLEVVMRGGNFGHFAADRMANVDRIWQRKWHTATSFVKNCSFSLRCAPKEAMWRVWQLALGQIGWQR
ncbi:MAG: nucleotidyltransferase family protein [Rikenellaceae bacterium]|nr:nucleotidyltransferase family protein [Rikenellaceae bacterium]